MAQPEVRSTEASMEIEESKGMESLDLTHT